MINSHSHIKHFAQRKLPTAGLSQFGKVDIGLSSRFAF